MLLYLQKFTPGVVRKKELSEWCLSEIEKYFEISLEQILVTSESLEPKSMC